MTQRIKVALILVCCVLVATCINLISTETGYAKQTATQGKRKLTVETKNGNLINYEVSIGDKIVIPMENDQGTIQITTGSNKIENKTIGIQSAAAWCTNDWMSMSYYSLLNIEVARYTVSVYLCLTGTTITYFDNPPSGNWYTMVGVWMAQHSARSGWISQPTQAYAQGDYVFQSGIPTPWGPVGNQCAGWNKIIFYGDYRPEYYSKTCI